MHTGLNFTLNNIKQGKLKDHLSPEDYNLEKRVSNIYCYLQTPLFSKSRRQFLGFFLKHQIHLFATTSQFPAQLCTWRNCLSLFQIGVFYCALHLLVAWGMLSGTNSSSPALCVLEYVFYKCVFYIFLFSSRNYRPTTMRQLEPLMPPMILT